MGLFSDFMTNNQMPDQALWTCKVQELSSIPGEQDKEDLSLYPVQALKFLHCCWYVWTEG